MERVTVPAAKVLETLNAVASEQPDYKYAAPEHQVSAGLSCYYVHMDADGENRTPGCLVGKVLNVLGVPLERLQTFEGTGAHVVADSVLEIKGEPDAVWEAMHALSTAQNEQDHGATWGDALSLATRKRGE